MLVILSDSTYLMFKYKCGCGELIYPVVVYQIAYKYVQINAWASYVMDQGHGQFSD